MTRGMPRGVACVTVSLFDALDRDLSMDKTLNADGGSVSTASGDDDPRSGTSGDEMPEHWGAEHHYGACAPCVGRSECPSMLEFAEDHRFELFGAVGLSEAPSGQTESTFALSEEQRRQAQLKALAHQGQVEAAEQMLMQMLVDEMVPSVDTYNIVILACTTGNNIERGRYWLDKIEEFGLQSNAVSYNLMLNACAKLGLLEGTEYWLQRMIDRQLEVSIVTYGTVCKLYGRHGSVERIQAIMDLLRTRQIPLNEYFYASLIAACGAAAPPQLGLAEQAYRDLVRDGLKGSSVRRLLKRVLGRKRFWRFCHLENAEAGDDGVAAYQGRAARRKEQHAYRQPKKVGPGTSLSSDTGDWYSQPCPWAKQRIASTNVQTQCLRVPSCSIAPPPGLEPVRHSRITF